MTIQSYVGVTPKSEFDLAENVEHGMPTESIAYLLDKGLTGAEVSWIVIPARSLKRRKALGVRLSTEETERALRLARILAQAELVFGKRDQALQWLRAPDGRLKDRTPLSMLLTEAGGRVVEGMLWQIDEGIYA